MKFEWDEKKRQSNIEKHDIDFIDAGELFRAPYINGPARIVNEEPR